MTDRDLVAEARTVEALLPDDNGRIADRDIRRARALLLALAEEVEALRGRLAVAVANQRTAEQAAAVQREQLDEVRTIAAKWAAQVPVDDAAVQQIEDGCELLLLIDGRTLPEEPR